MFGGLLKKKTLFLISGFSLIVILIKFVFWADPRTKVVFCDVGQGDASYIRVKNQIDILVDAGGNKKVLDCLGRYMPFWDRKIELVIISHPQKDHFGGLLFVIDRYQIDRVLIPPIKSQAGSFNSLIKKISRKKIPLLAVTAGTELKILTDEIVFLWPTSGFVKNQTLTSNDVLGTATIDSNHFSLIFLFIEKDIKILYTGDATPLALNSLISQSKNNLALLNNLKIMKVPHHGSKNGLTERFLSLAKPDIAVISVGKKNSYGHPSKEILSMLEAKKVKIERTDKKGHILFKL